MSAEGDALLDEVLENIPKREFVFLDELHHQPSGNARESWQKCAELADRYDKDLCEAYREQIDTLLVFAGLFSAVVTAFAIESYKWLQGDPDSVSDALLARIADILARNLTGTPTSQGTIAPAAGGGLSAAVAVRINIYWFLSLTLSLSAALVGILAKQWLREFVRDAGRTHSQTLGVRQMKFEGLEAWRVCDIVSSVPLLLQVALALFAIGILELLWHLNVVVAIPVTALAFLAAVFYLATALLPGFRFAQWLLTRNSSATQCPYKSPQAWLFIRLISALLAYVASENAMIKDWAFGRGNYDITAHPRSWVSFDIAWTNLSDAQKVARPQYKFKALSWLRHTLEHTELPLWHWHCLWSAVPTQHSFPEAFHRALDNIAYNFSDTYDLQALRESWLSSFTAAGGLAMMLQARSLILEYAPLLPLSVDAVTELLCSIVEGEPAPSAAFADFMLDNMPDPLGRRERKVDLVNAERLFCAARRIVRAPHLDAHGPARTLCALLDVVALAERCERSTALFLGVCALMHARVCDDHDGVLYACYVLNATARRLADPDTGRLALDSETGDRTTRVLALLASAIDSAWRRAGSDTALPAGSSYLRHPHLCEIFQWLVALGRALRERRAASPPPPPGEHAPKNQEIPLASGGDSPEANLAHFGSGGLRGTIQATATGAFEGTLTDKRTS